MKYFLIFLLFLSTSAFANIGKITAVKGEASIFRDSKTLTPTVGFILEKNDKVSTKDNSRIQIVFKDSTIISLGKKTSLDINDYFYDELEPKKVNASFKFTKGVFKTITGKIALINPNKFQLKTKSATIGIRGTTFFGDIKDDGSEDISCTFGAIAVQTRQGIVEVQAGQSTSFAFGKAPTPPKKMTATQKENIESNSGAAENEKESGQDESSVPLDSLHQGIVAVTNTVVINKNTSENTLEDSSDILDDQKDEEANNPKDEETSDPDSTISSGGLYGITMANLYSGGSHVGDNSSLYKNGTTEVTDFNQMFDTKLADTDLNAYLSLHGSTYSVKVPAAVDEDTDTYTITSLANGDYKEVPDQTLSTTHTDGTKITYTGSYGIYDSDTHDIDSYLSWGTWSKTNGGIEYTIQEGEPSTTVSIENSTWIAGKFTTPSEVPTTGSASYSGSVEGFHTAGSAMTGTIGIDVDFAQNTISSNLNINYEGGSSFGSVSGIAGGVKRFNNNVEFKGTGTDGSTSATIGGAFYGSNAKAAGGVWTMSNGSEQANGTFATSKQ